MNDLIRTLVEAYGPSGFEDPVRDLIRPMVEPHADEVNVDPMGNLIVRKRATGDAANPLKVIIAAHMDEIGVMVSHITEQGFLRFTNIGGVFPHTLLGGRVRFAFHLRTEDPGTLVKSARQAVEGVSGVSELKVDLQLPKLGGAAETCAA